MTGSGGASATTVSDERRGYRRQLFDLLETHLLPLAAAAPDATKREER